MEVVLCYALFHIFDPHRFGGSTLHRLPPITATLASLFVRTPASVLSKMLNLDGSRANSGRFEWPFFVEMAVDPGRFAVLYSTTIAAARDVGIHPDRLPDFLVEHGIELGLLGQDELVGRTFESVVEIRAAKIRVGSLPADEEQTTRLAEQAIRLGQHRFANDVLTQYDHTCAFCGFAPKSIPGNRLLVASHVKPWAASNDEERLDPRNGVAACPTHDAAFDTGLITVNGGFRLHRSPDLAESARSDAEVDRYFGESLSERLLIPSGGDGPAESYLEWHHRHIYQGKLAS